MAKRYLGGGVSFEQKDVYQEFSEDDSGGGSSTLSGLTDVDISNPTDGQTLVYNAATGKWENGAGGAGVRVINGVYDSENEDVSTTITGSELLNAYLGGKVLIHWVQEIKTPAGTVDSNVYLDLTSVQDAGELGATFCGSAASFTIKTNPVAPTDMVVFAVMSK